ncbi:MAG: glycoside hydrolase family 2 TIM barrel-domain containing protein [Odoribacter sp.]
MKKGSLFIILAMILIQAFADKIQPEFSTAGFYDLPGCGREVLNMNVAWRFQRGKILRAAETDYPDTNWSVVSLPHGIEYLSPEASGGVNYRGEVWYRKHFNIPQQLRKKKLFLHFEAIMGKSKIWVNGQLLKTHFGGFLPVIIDITPVARWDQENVIAVWADNSDDPSYPPGKPQGMLDFAYFGGIYRDCWLIAHEPLYITDANYENEKAGGGLLIGYENVSDRQALLTLKSHLRNERKTPFNGTIEYELLEKTGTQIAAQQQKIHLQIGQAAHFESRMTVKKPRLWSPETPYLYDLSIRIKDQQGKVIDGYTRRVGIRSVEFKGKDGFWLNGRPYPRKLIGANRHQDFAIVGNALSNNIHWRDAKKLREAGMTIIRNAHYPQDPAFMDACDQLGLFVIVNTPGWQFWNQQAIFGERVYSDIRNMVRRDRNHPSVLLWEPILNETHYPADFAGNALHIVREEYPCPGCYAACDGQARGSSLYPVIFGHPGKDEYSIEKKEDSKVYFTREWGDNVDDWNAHNSTSRVHLAWGETPMLIQAKHYANPSYPYTSYNSLYETDRQHFGGTLWHSFDHQRGYHPDPFYGGVMDVFRQPKYSYYLFMAQRPLDTTGYIGAGPMVYIAHEMTPFSGKDVTVYSNCDEVRLQLFAGGKVYTYERPFPAKGMPSPIITFKDVYDFMEMKDLARQGKQQDVYMLAEGIVNGKVVAQHRREPALRPQKLILWLDNEGTHLEADGSDFVTVVAGVADERGNIKRLNQYDLTFTVEGEGRILGEQAEEGYARKVIWGCLPVLIQSTTRAGKIKVRAAVKYKGEHTPQAAEIEFESIPATRFLLYAPAEQTALEKNNHAISIHHTSTQTELKQENERLRKELNALKLKEVERQQEDFGEQPSATPK